MIVLIILLAATSLFLDACRTNCNIKLQEVQNRYNNKKKEVDIFKADSGVSGYIQVLKDFQKNPIPDDATCQNASNAYNIVSGKSFGCAPQNVQTWWKAKQCNTNPSGDQTTNATRSCTYQKDLQELSSIQKELDPLKTLQTSLNNIHYCFIATVCILPISWFFLFKFLSIYRSENLTYSKGSRGWGWANVVLSGSLLIPIGIIIYTLITNVSSMKKQLNFILFIVTIVLLSATIAWIAIGQGIFHPTIMSSKLSKIRQMTSQTDTKAGEAAAPAAKQFNMNDPAVYLMERVL